jgi:hypothetical protein
MTYRVRHPELHQEEDTVPGWKVLLAVAVTLLVSGVLIGWSISMLDAREAELRPSRSFPEQLLGPRRRVSGVEQSLFAEPARGIVQAARARRELDRYQWVDRELGIVRIPIERAIELRAREGAP